MKVKRLNEWINPVDNPVFEDIIKKLTDLSIDGESMQDILEKIGMEEQMLDQLVATYPANALIKLIDLDDDAKLDIEELDDYLFDTMNKNPKFFEKIKDFVLRVEAGRYNLL